MFPVTAAIGGWKASPGRPAYLFWPPLCAWVSGLCLQQQLPGRQLLLCRYAPASEQTAALTPPQQRSAAAASKEGNDQAGHTKDDQRQQVGHADPVDSRGARDRVTRAAEGRGTAAAERDAAEQNALIKAHHVSRQVQLRQEQSGGVLTCFGRLMQS